MFLGHCTPQIDAAVVPAQVGRDFSIRLLMLRILHGWHETCVNRRRRKRPYVPEGARTIEDEVIYPRVILIGNYLQEILVR